MYFLFMHNVLLLMKALIKQYDIPNKCDNEKMIMFDSENCRGLNKVVQKKV